MSTTGEALAMCFGLGNTDKPGNDNGLTGVFGLRGATLGAGFDDDVFFW